MSQLPNTLSKRSMRLAQAALCIPAGADKQARLCGAPGIAVPQDVLWWVLYKAENVLQGSWLRKVALAECMKHIHYEVTVLKKGVQAWGALGAA